MSHSDRPLPPEFEEALLSLRGHRTRGEVILNEVPAPTRIAPYAAALTAEVNFGTDPEDMLGSGRFVVLFDPAGQPAWNGLMRLVVLGRAEQELAHASDPGLAAVGWSWLTDALTEREAQFHTLSGTVTRVMSESFAGLDPAGPAEELEMELRASWTPHGYDLSAHFQAWLDLVSSMAGLAPVESGVSQLVPRR